MLSAWLATTLLPGRGTLALTWSRRACANRDEDRPNRPTHYRTRDPTPNQDQSSNTDPDPRHTDPDQQHQDPRTDQTQHTCDKTKTKTHHADADQRTTDHHQAAWVDKLWRAYKLSDEVYEEYFHFCKEGLSNRKRNYEVHRAWVENRRLDQEMEQRAKRIHSNPALYQPFGVVAEAQDWLAHFTADALRYPLLLVHAPSRAGKTEWAESLFRNPLTVEVGGLDHFPDGLRELDRSKHDGLVLDDVRDLAFLSLNQGKLQGKYRRKVEFASTPGGQCAFTKDMFRLPIAVTVNNDTKNLDFLTTNDFLSHPDNVHLLSFPGRPGTAPPSRTLLPRAPKDSTAGP